MTNGSNSTKKIIALILIVAGTALIYWGFQESEGFNAKVTKAFSGSEPDYVMYKYIGGAVSAAVGLYLLIKK